MKFNFIIFLIFNTLLISSCDFDNTISTDEECDFPDYSTCDTYNPSTAFLDIYLTINDENPTVKLDIYDGDVENGYLYAQINADSSYTYLEVAIDREYSISAHYKSGEDSIFAVDGTNLRKQSYEYCDSTCWSIYGGRLDVRLKK